MQFGVREICDVVFKAKSDMKIGTTQFVAGQPVIYIDSATASQLEQATTTVYARGGKGNVKLITWDGEKELTFTVTDALLTPQGFTILSGAGLFGGDGDESKGQVHFHKTVTTKLDVTGKVIDLTNILSDADKIDPTAPVFISAAEKDGSLTGTYASTEAGSATIDTTSGKKITLTNKMVADMVFVDFYVKRSAGKAYEMQIDASSFDGNFYVEASTLFRKRADGKDMPAELTFPNVKISSAFTFQMASSGDPSTFDFTMDAMPGYTFFDSTRKVMCVVQMVDDASVEEDPHSVMACTETELIQVGSVIK